MDKIEVEEFLKKHGISQGELVTSTTRSFYEDTWEETVVSLIGLGKVIEAAKKESGQV